MMMRFRLFNKRNNKLLTEFVLCQQKHAMQFQGSKVKCSSVTRLPIILPLLLFPAAVSESRKISDIGKVLISVIICA